MPPTNSVIEVTQLAPPLDGGGGAGAARGFIVGRSGSGKSFLAKNLLTAYRCGEGCEKTYRGSLVIIDPNHNFDFPHNTLATKPEDIVLNKRSPVTLYRPSAGNLGAEGWNEVWARLFKTPGRVMTYVDEVYAMEPLFGVKRLPQGVNYLNAYLTQGRARGKGALMSAQRPVSIPRNVSGQGEYFYMFDLPLEDDRMYMASIMGRLGANGADLRERTSLGRYEFWFLGPDMTAPLRMKIKS